MIFNKLVLYSFLFGAVIQILFWMLIYSRLAFYKVKKPNLELPQRPVSVIICAKNEAHNLPIILPPILEQNYSTFEVLVVNDHSSDATAAILKDLQKKYNHLKVLHLTDENRAVKGKKYALSKGIETAKYDLLLLTDADCIPSSSNWINMMQSQIIDKKSIVIAYAPLNQKKSFVNLLAQIDTTNTAFQYFGIGLFGFPYMGVGRNLMYKKSIFHKNNGFENHEHIASGDDDLFITEVATRQNTNFILHPDTFMYSDAKQDLKSFFRQKSRHVSTSPHYRPIHIIILGLQSLSLFFYHIYPIYLIIAGFGVELVGIFYIARMLLIWMVGYFALKKLKVWELWWAFPLLDVLYLLYLILLSPSLIFRKTNTWA